MQIFGEISCMCIKQRFTLRHTLAAISDRRYADPHIGAKADCQPIAQQEALYEHNVNAAATGYLRSIRIIAQACGGENVESLWMCKLFLGIMHLVVATCNR